MDDPQDNRQSTPNFASLFLVLFILLIVLVFFNSQIFEVKSIIVQGNQTLSNEDILRNTNLNLYQNIFQVDCNQLQRIILNNSRIAAVQVNYQLPDKIVIKIQERVPVCLLLFSDNLLLIGEDAVVMSIKDENEPIKLPVVTGIVINKIKIGEKVKDPQFKVAMEILRYADENLKVILGEIDVKNYLLYIDVPNAQHTLKVELGDSSQLNEKITKNLRSILSHTAPDELLKIDLRVTSFPTAIKRNIHK